MAPKRTIRSSPAPTTTTTTPMTDEQLKTLIAQGVANVLAERDATRSRNGEDNLDSGTGVRRQAPLARECTYPDFMKCKPLYFKGTEGVIELTQWFERMETVFCISNCTVENQIKFATSFSGASIARMFPEESDKIEKYVGGLPDMIHKSVKASKPKTTQDAIEFATELVDKKISTFAERQDENKRKFDDTSKNNQNQQQKNKRHNTNRAYNYQGSGEKKLTECWPSGRGQKATCYECGAQGHFMREYPKLKNNNHGNQGGNGNAPTKVYVVGNAWTNPDSNAVTGTFLLNNRYASILFDTGADRSFVSTAFSSLIVITPTTLDHYYDVELADGKIIGINTIIQGCTLNLLNHPFNINLIPVELGSFDVIIGMDWLAKYHAVIVCAEKIVRIPWGNETLIVRGDESNWGNETRDETSSKAKKRLRPCQSFWECFLRFNTIITSLKALDESFSVVNHVRKFLRALPTKWRPKVLEVLRTRKEKYISLALKARQVLSEEDASSSDSNDEEYAMAVRDFKNFFRRRGKFVRQPYDDKKNFQKAKEDKKEKEDRRCFKCGDPNHFINDCPKHSFGDQKAFIVGCWSDSGDDSKKEEICLMAQSNKVRLKVNHELDEWIKDSGCTKHMTGNKDLFSSYKAIDGETIRVEESLNVKFDESPPPKSPPLVDDDILENDIIENQDKDLEIKENEPLNKEITNIKHSKDHPLETVIGSLNERTLRSQVQNQSNFFCFVSTGTFQQEGIDFDETYAPVARLEYIRFLLVYACAHNFKLYQMDVKSAFLNGFRNEEVYLAQPPRFVDSEKPNHVFKLKKAIYGLKQAPKAWYDRLKAFLIDHEYTMGKAKKISLEDSKPIKTSMSSKTKLTHDEDGEPIDNTKYRGMIGSLLYLTASFSDIMFSVCLCARFQEAPKTSHLEVVKRIFRYIKGTSHLGLWYPKGTSLETIVYDDSDHARDYVDRKSTSGVCTFMGCCLTSWFSEKQTTLAISTIEAKYVFASKACQKALWMKQALVDYDIKLDDIPVLCDNKGAIDLSKNHVLHSPYKNIVIRLHFPFVTMFKKGISLLKKSLPKIT
ncbi:retrovirus-related pol polyprotein from transposon TNT 1-94 [Tanacetum coccineum]